MKALITPNKDYKMKSIIIRFNDYRQWLEVCSSWIFASNLFQLKLHKAFVNWTAFHNKHDDDRVKFVVTEMEELLKSTIDLKNPGKFLEGRIVENNVLGDLIQRTRFDMLRESGAMCLTEDTLKALIRNLDAYSRVYSGQVTYALEPLTDALVYGAFDSIDPVTPNGNSKSRSISEVMFTLRGMSTQLKFSVAGLVENESFGINTDDMCDRSRVAYDVLKRLRKNDDNGSTMVYSRECKKTIVVEETNFDLRSLDQ
jgi:hypothetical protein